MTSVFYFYCRVIARSRRTAEALFASSLHDFLSRADFSAMAMLPHYDLLELAREPALDPEAERAAPLTAPPLAASDL